MKTIVGDVAHVRRPAAARYAVAFSLVVIAAVFSAVLGDTFLAPMKFFFFWCAILLSALYGGTAPGLFAVALSSIAVSYVFFDREHAVFYATPIDLARLTIFVLFSALISYAVGARRRAELRADAVREWVETTLASIGDAVIATDREGTIVFMNATAERLTGWTRSEARERKLSEVFRIIDEVTREATPNPADRAIAEGRIVALANHTVLIARDGREIPIDDSAAPIDDAEGNRRGAVLVFHDVATQRFAQRALRASEQHFRSLADSAPVMIWMSNAEQQRTFVNRQWLAFTGRSADEEARRPWSDGIHPDDRQNAVLAFDEAFRRHEAFEIEYRRERADREYRWFVDHAVPRRNADGQFEGFTGSCVDITDRKRTEANLRFLASASALMAESLDYDRLFERLTALAVPDLADWCAIVVPDEQRGYRQIAVAHVDSSKVKLSWELQAKRPPARESSPVMTVLREGKSVRVEALSDEQLRAMSASEELFRIAHDLGFISFMVVPLQSRSETFGAVLFVSAESQHHFSELDLAQAEEFARRAASSIENARLYKEAQDANRAKDEFLATVSHELRTPLTAILGWSKLLIGNDDAATQRVGLETILRSARAQNELIDDILDAARFITGKLHLEIAAVDGAAVVREVAEAVRPAAAAKRITVTTNVSHPSIPFAADPKRVRQIIWNLVTNALKFTDPGGNIELAALRSGDSVRFQVRDDGRGIDPMFLPRIWDRFTQGDSSTTREHGGLGLGLSLARYLAELHGGTIEAESAGRGRGSTFTVTLPLTAASTNADIGTPREKTSLRGRRALVVDDDHASRDIVATILERNGASVSVAADANQALEALKQEKFDVVVTDIAMPGVDGFRLAEQIRANGNGQRIIAVTALMNVRDRSNFDAVLQKPIDPDDLVTEVSRALTG